MKILLLSLMLFVISCKQPNKISYDDSSIVGWIENVNLYPMNIKFKAKLDTGAKTCSIHADNITEFEKDNEQWVRFDITNSEGKGTTVEKRISRYVKIKRKGASSQNRIVVKLGICLGNYNKIAEVNLVNRKKFIYKLLIGRNYLKNGFFVDSSKTFTVEPQCKE